MTGQKQFCKIFSFCKDICKKYVMHSSWLWWHNKDYADTFKNFEGFSLILQEQSGKKNTWVCLQF